MSDGKTPETDAAYENDLRKTCKRLERERDEAREQHDELIEKYRSHHEEAERLTSEIDELRRLFESSKSARKSLSDACDHLQRERDEARKQRDRLADALQSVAEDLNHELVNRMTNPEATWCSLRDANEALASVKGGSHE